MTEVAPFPGRPSANEASIPQIGREGMLAGGDDSGIKVAQSGQSEELGLIMSGANKGSFVNRATLLRMNGENRLATNVTIALALQRAGSRPLGQENTTFPVRAEITFGQAGAQTSLVCDYINGALLTLPGSWVQLEAVIDNMTQQQVGEMTVAAIAFASYLPVGHVRQAQRTLRAALAANGGADSVVLPVPSFAQTVTLLSDKPGASFTLSQCTDSAGAVVVTSETIPVVPPHVDVPLVNEARYIKVTNLLNAAVNLRALFGLYV